MGDGSISPLPDRPGGETDPPKRCPVHLYSTIITITARCTMELLNTNKQMLRCIEEMSLLVISDLDGHHYVFVFAHGRNFQPPLFIDG